MGHVPATHPLMQRLFAITALTWKAAFRFRLFWVLMALLLAVVAVLPALIKDDGTARGFIQIMLTYTLSMITALLGFSTLWLACGTLARDIEENQMQMVAVKPVARWQIWLGKWLGLVLLNALLLAISGGTVYGMLQWRARQLPAGEQKILREEIFVARASLREPVPDLEAEIEKAFQSNPKAQAMPIAEQTEARRRMRDRLQAELTYVRPNTARAWTIDLGLRRHLLRDQPLFLRVRFHAAQTNRTGTYVGVWQIAPNSPRAIGMPQSLAPDVFHEISLPPNMYDEKGLLKIQFINVSESALVFPMADGLEVLYREGGFELNFARGLGVILCWMALLAALGLASASSLSFPVAAFFSFSLLILSLSSGSISNVVEEGSVTGPDHETGQVSPTAIDLVIIPLFKAILSVVNLVQSFAPVDALSTGRSITWGQLGLAATQIVLVMGGAIALAGMLLFSKRELATAQGQT